MSLIVIFLLTLLVVAAAWIQDRRMGIVAMLLALMVPFALYYWAGMGMATFLWSWALPFVAAVIPLLPASRWLYVWVFRRMNGWSMFTLEILDEHDHLHYVKGIDQGTYINGGPGAGKTASPNKAFARHAAHFGMSILIHDLKCYELSEVLYPIYAQKQIPYKVFALFDPSRSVRINPISPEYIPDEASLRARVKSFILAVQGRESSDSTADFFNSASSSLLEAVIWYLHQYRPEYCTLPMVMSIISNPDNLHLRQEGHKPIPFGKIERLLKRDPQVYAMASAFLQGSGNTDTTANILQTLILALNTINTDAGFYLLSGNDIDLHLNRAGSQVAFALVNDPKNTAAYTPILAMIEDAAMTMMCTKGSQPAMVLLDEAPELPNARIQNYTAFFRSLKVCMVYTTQDLSQIQRTQGGKEYNMRTLLSNFAHQFFGRTSSEQTAKYCEGMMPQVERTEYAYSSSTSGSSTSRRKVRRPLYSKDEFYALRQGEFVYFHGRVERFRFKYRQEPKCLPPPIRQVEASEMHLLSERIRQQAVDFMNEFQ